MKRSDFFYHLPPELIAQAPPENRGESRLLVMDRQSGTLHHETFSHLPNYLKKGDVLVVNDTRVLPARLFGRRESGANVEFLLLERRGDHWCCLVKPGKKARVGDRFQFPGMQGEILSILEEGTRLVRFECDGVFEEVLESIGETPLPPYIYETLEDKERYQTIYARENGSSAAPTAGLHFTEEMFSLLREKGISVAHLTLHVGLGTFRPVKADLIEDHHMHSEWYHLDGANAAIIESAERVIAVGTTSVRTLESIARKHGRIRADEGKTDIFLYPGCSFQVVSGLITNFHLPESTLLMLVSAFSSREAVLHAYQEAIQERYRFFSFGDAMLITDWENSCSHSNY